MGHPGRRGWVSPEVWVPGNDRRGCREVLLFISRASQPHPEIRRVVRYAGDHLLP